MPEDTQRGAALVFVALSLSKGEVFYNIKCIVDAQILVVFGDQFLQPTPGGDEQGEVFGDVQETGRLAHAAQDGIQGDDALFAFAVDLLPLTEVFPCAGQGADFGLAAIGQDDDGVVPEQVWDSILIIT